MRRPVHHLLQTPSIDSISVFPKTNAVFLFMSTYPYLLTPARDRRISHAYILASAESFLSDAVKKLETMNPTLSYTTPSPQHDWNEGHRRLNKRNINLPEYRDGALTSFCADDQRIPKEALELMLSIFKWNPSKRLNSAGVGVVQWEMEGYYFQFSRFSNTTISVTCRKLARNKRYRIQLN